MPPAEFLDDFAGGSNYIFAVEEQEGSFTSTVCSSHIFASIVSLLNDRGWRVYAQTFEHVLVLN